MVSVPPEAALRSLAPAAAAEMDPVATTEAARSSTDANLPTLSTECPPLLHCCTSVRASRHSED
jgi:hypothetical protein